LFRIPNAGFAGWFFPLIALLVIGLGPGSAWAFLPNPDLLTVSPATAKAGTTVEVRISGTNLDEARTLRFTEKRIRVKPVTRPADEFVAEPQPVPNRFEVTIPEDVAPGVYEVRSLGYFGLSTARPFLVVEPDAREIAEEGNHASPETAFPIDLNSAVTGRLESRRVDWYRFEARRGERILAQVWAERLDSRADVLLVLSDSEGRELESSRLHFGRDPLVDVRVPADGEYFLAVSDTLYRGNAQFFYRLELSTDPLVDFVFPPAGRPGAEQDFVFHGRNLPGGSLGEGLSWEGKPIETLDVRLEVPEEARVPPGIFPGKPRQGMLPAFTHRIEGANPVRIGFATAPVREEQQGRERQKLEVPCEVAGRFEERGDFDVYRFPAKKGQTWWVEVMSERLGCLTDPYLLVERIQTDEAGVETVSKVAENDDPPSFYGADALDDTNADTLDAALSFTAKEDGLYQVTIVNQSAGGSIAHLYRLAIRQAQPDFQLISATERTKTINNDAYPAAPLLRRGGSMVYRILALRRDGFEGDIVVRAAGLPNGVSSEPLVLSGDTREGYLPLQAAPDAKPWAGAIRIQGTAQIEGREVVRDARSASIIWGTRVFAHQRQVRSRLDEENVLSVMAAETEPCRLAVPGDRRYSVKLKEKLEIPVRVEDAGARKGNLQVEPFGLPGMLRRPPKVLIQEGESEGTLVIDFTPKGSFKVKPGTCQFVLRGIGNARYRQNPEGAKRAEAELERLEKLAAEFAAKEKAERKRVAELEAVVKKSRQATGEASDEASQEAAKSDPAKAERELEAARQELANLSASVKKSASVLKSARKEAQAAAKLAQEKTSRFATYSLPITVTVLKSEPR